MKQVKYETIEEGLLSHSIDPKTNDALLLKGFLDNRISELTLEQKKAIDIQVVRVQMKEYLRSSIKKSEVIGSGEFLRNLLKELEIKQNHFAEYVGIKPSNLSKLLNGERRISFDFSLVLEQLFNIESGLWLSIQSKNRLTRMQKEELHSFKKFNLKDLISQRKNVG